jgi:hypothetical protein
MTILFHFKAEHFCTNIFFLAKFNSSKSVEIKCQLDATDVFIADLIACSTCLGHHYAHHQELESIIQIGHKTRNYTLYRQLENQAPNTTDSNHLYNPLELLMLGIMVPETC